MFRVSSIDIFKQFPVYYIGMYMYNNCCRYKDTLQGILALLNYTVFIILLHSIVDKDMFGWFTYSPHMVY